MKAISLFAGCGGDTLGLENTGIEVVGFVEFWNKAIKTHKLNFPNSKFIGEDFKGDITKIPDEEFLKYKGKIDILFAGFPCQGFSHAGKKDPNDKRNKLFWEFVRVANLIQPKWVIGENVAGLMHRKTDDGKSKVSDIITNAFEEIGYKMAEPKVLKAEEFGVPQKRRRVFFVGNREGKDFEFPEPITKNNPPTIRKIIEDTNFEGLGFNPSIIEDFKEDELVHNYNSNELPDGKPHPYLILKIKDNKVSHTRRVSPFHIEIANLDAPTKTIHCGYAFQPRLFVLVKNNKGYFIRAFTTKELWQFQGFSKNYKFFGSKDDIIKQIGNAVPPPLVEAIANEIIRIEKENQNPASAKISPTLSAEVS